MIRKLLASVTLDEVGIRLYELSKEEGGNFHPQREKLKKWHILPNFRATEQKKLNY